MLAKTSLSTRFAFVQSRNVVALQQALKNHGNSVAHFSSNNSRVLAETIKTTVGTAAAPKQTKQNDTATPASTKAAADPNFWTIRGSVNSVYLIGTVSSDPVFKQVANGSTMTSFSIVTSERIKKKDGTIQEQTNFHNIVSFDNLLARVAQKYLKKGFIVNVKGKLTYREVKKEGTDITYNVPQIVVSQFSDLKVIYGKVPRDQTQ